METNTVEEFADEANNNKGSFTMSSFMSIFCCKKYSSGKDNDIEPIPIVVHQSFISKDIDIKRNNSEICSDEVSFALGSVDVHNKSNLNEIGYNEDESSNCFIGNDTKIVNGGSSPQKNIECWSEDKVGNSKNSNTYKIELNSELGKNLTQLSIEENLYFNFPILVDSRTMKYMNISKVLFIMRGLPGSGKSTVVSKIKMFYPNSSICSADDYFMENGKYIFNHEKLKDAHNYCKKMAIEAVQKRIAHVIIDNTNIQQWEMKYYCELAKEFNYVTIFIEPKTPWAWDALELSRRTTHGVDLEILQKKVHSYQEISPLYYGWFLNETDSHLLFTAFISCLERALSSKDFSNQFGNVSGIWNIHDATNHYCNERSKLVSRMHHCTTRYQGGKRDCYSKSPCVVDALGKVEILIIVSFIITNSICSARLKLTEKQRLIFEGGGHECADDCSNRNKKRFWHGPPSDIAIPKNASKIEESLTQSTLVHEEPNEDSGEVRLILDERHSSTAHISMATADGVAPVICGSVQKDLLNKEFEFGERNVKIYDLDDMVIRQYEEDLWEFVINKQIKVESLFSCQL